MNHSPPEAVKPLHVGSILFSRLGINTGFRMVYPFLPVIARGLDVAPTAIVLAITLRSTLGIFAPVLGSIGDSIGRKRAMLIGMALFMAGSLLLGVWPSYAMLVVSLLTLSVSKIIFDPAGYAYLGDRVSYGRRGLVVGFIELGWSGAFLLGMPLVGLAIAQGSWSSPFPWLALSGALASIWIWRGLPESQRPPRLDRPSLRSKLGSILASRSALAALTIGLLISLANEVVGIVYGLWMEGGFGLEITSLGLASIVIGVAELGGEGLVAGFSDLVGKRRAIGAGILASMLAGIALPFLGAHLFGALAGLFLVYLSFEFALVSSLPLMTEQVPGARATLMGVNVTGLALGRAAGAFIGAPLFQWGIAANGITSAILNGFALYLLIRFVREG